MSGAAGRFPGNWSAELPAEPGLYKLRREGQWRVMLALLDRRTWRAVFVCSLCLPRRLGRGLSSRWGVAAAPSSIIVSLRSPSHSHFRRPLRCVCSRIAREVSLEKGVADFRADSSSYMFVHCLEEQLLVSENIVCVVFFLHEVYRNSHSPLHSIERFSCLKCFLIRLMQSLNIVRLNDGKGIECLCTYSDHHLLRYRVV